MYVQFGCGLSAPDGWVNFDASPTLRLQRIPVVKHITRKTIGPKFPKQVKYGDVIKGLPVIKGSCSGVYCSHVLEHLSLEDFRKALKHSYQLLKPDGIFRLVMPDLQNMAKSYFGNREENNPEAAIKFIKAMQIGSESRDRGLRKVVKAMFANHQHLWLWDEEGTIHELNKIGFSDIRSCKFNDCEDSNFALVEDESRFVGSIAIEARRR